MKDVTEARREAAARLAEIREQLRVAEEAYQQADDAVRAAIRESRERWGRGFKATYNADHHLTGLVDGHGREVPEADWDSFCAYRAALDEDRFAAIIDGQRMMQL